MKSRIGNVISNNIRENMGVYFTVTLFFSIGLAAGAFTLKAMDNAQKQDLVIYLNRFFQIIKGENISGGRAFYQSIKNNFQTVFLIWIFGITVVGVPLTLFVTSFRGFILGFTVSFLIQGLGWKGFLCFIASVLPQNIIYVPCILIISALSLRFSLNIFKRKVKRGIMDTIKSSILSYTTAVVIIFLIMCIGSIIEAYISPHILKWMSNLMIAQ